MKIVTYLLFDGTCEEAFRFYETALNGQNLQLMTHAGTPASEHVPAGWQDKIMHACLTVGDSVIMASDVPPEHQKPRGGFSVSYHAADEVEAERVFAALSAGGAVREAGRSRRRAVDGELHGAGRLTSWQCAIDPYRSGGV